MRKIINLVIIGLVSFTVVSCTPNKKNSISTLENTSKHSHAHFTNKNTKQKYIAEVIQPTTLKINKKNIVILKIKDSNNTPLLLNQLQEVHTKKIHWLIVDDTLSDYHHIHPVSAKEKGTYIASFIPKNNGNYKIWVDITPVGQTQQYIPVTLHSNNHSKKHINKKVIVDNIVGNIHAKLTFNKPLKVGTANVGKVFLTTAKGNPITNLEPLMGAFSHIVGFYEDFNTTLHAHPMGKEPTKNSERSGPELMFHFTPEKAGFLKIYVQIKQNNKDIFIPFGIIIN